MPKFDPSIHQNDPALTHASYSTECTICAASRPSNAKLSKRCRSVVVKILQMCARSGDGISRGVGVLSFVGKAILDNMEDAERRLVLAGVHTGYDIG